MPQYKTGNMFTAHEDEGYSIDAIFVTANSYIKQGGKLTMGAGAAKDMLNQYPNIDKTFGERLLSKHMVAYHILALPVYEQSVAILGLFQTKFHWNTPSDLALIEQSTQMLAYFADMFNGTIALNYPGIGLGRRTEEEVKPILDILPNNVWIYKL
jgi:hypothetical protein